jgi:flagellin-like protein
MKNSVKAKKALSPVVASIILIAVAVVISIATAGWLSALSQKNMELEEVRIVNVSFGPQTATLEFYNTGSFDVVVTEIRVGSGANLLNSDVGLSSNSLERVTIGLSWTSGDKYQFVALSARGNVFVYDALAFGS